MREPWCRVLVVEPGDGLWGAQRSVLRLADLLEREGVQQILAAPAASSLATRWREAGRKHVVFDPPPERSVRRADGRWSLVGLLREAGRTVRGSVQLAELARRTGADVLHANGHWTHLEVAVAGRLARRPTLLYLHEQSQRDVLGRLRAIAVRGAAASVGVSAAVVNSLPDRVRGRVRVVPNGVDPVEFAPGPADPTVRAELSAEPKAPLVLVVARVEPRKGIAAVVRAVHGLPESLADTALAVVGAVADSAYEVEVRRLGDELLGDRLRLLGPRSDIGSLLRAADVLVLASETEGMPLSVLEAQACGTPVVAYPAGGTAELISHEITGLLARQGDPVDLSRQIERTLVDQELTGRIVAAARDRVCAGASLRHQADAFLHILRELMAARVRRIRS